MLKLLKIMYLYIYLISLINRESIHEIVVSSSKLVNGEIVCKSHETTNSLEFQSFFYTRITSKEGMEEGNSKFTLHQGV